MPRGVYERNEKYKEMMRRAKKGQSPNHKFDCQCPFCKTKRGELRGENNPNWKGGIVNLNGYMFILKHDHPKAYINKGYVRRSHLIAEEILGRHLYPDEITHHKNGITDDDRPENIEVMESKSIHTTYHQQGKKCSEETKRKISKANKGKIPWNKGGLNVN